MIRLMSSGVSGIRNHQLRMDVIGNNISNVNTTGYKTGRANFKDTLYQAIGTAGSAGDCQVGSGISIGSISNNFNQGPLQYTGRTLDLGIAGQGFFGLLDENNELKYFTKDGTFFINQDGDLVNSAGLKVANSDGDPIEQIELGEGQSWDDLSINEFGLISLAADQKDTIGLFNFTNPGALTKAGDNLFMENNNTGERISNEEDDKAFGKIRSGYLEMSNIDIAEELANLIATQRGFQANSRVFTTADEILQDIVALKR